jgi:lipopolysaccharide export system permease protein
MKLIDKLILKAFFRPFLVTFCIVMFLLLMLFLFKYIDDLVGKGFEWYVIIELLFYASASQVSVALPLAVLLSSIMTYGALGEYYELVALKSGGISLQRALRPLFIFSLFLSVLAFVFSNWVLPVANLKMGSLLYDVRQQKPSFILKENVFYDGIEGYAIRVGKIGKDDFIQDIIIYDKSDGGKAPIIIAADSGYMKKTQDGLVLEMTLLNGFILEESPAENQIIYNPRMKFTRIQFSKHLAKLDLSGFRMNRTDEGLFKSNFLMLNISQLKESSDSLFLELKEREKSNINYGMLNYLYFNPQRNSSNYFGQAGNESAQIQLAINEIRNLKSYYLTEGESRKAFIRNLLRFLIEVQRRITISVACFVFFLIGAPFGAIVRKGGLGLPVVVSVGLFILNYIISMTAEKYCRSASLPVEGMWLSTMIFIPLGAYFIRKSSYESALFSMDSYLKFFKKLKLTK